MHKFPFKTSSPNTWLPGVSVVSRTSSQEFDANWFRPVSDGLFGLEGETDMAITEG